MMTDNFCFYLQNRIIQISHTGGLPPLVFPGPWQAIQPSLTYTQSAGLYNVHGQPSVNMTKPGPSFQLCKELHVSHALVLQ
jgi:hypothetical protein